MQNNETVYIRNEIFKCEDVEELQEKILPILKAQQEQWKQKVEEIIKKGNFSKSRFAELLGVSRVTVNKWCNGSIPKNRETFLKIGMIAGYNRKEMDKFLQRYGKYSGLYSKSLEDCVCIFALERDYDEKILEQYNSILNKIKEFPDEEKSDYEEDIDTVLLDEKLSDVKDIDDLELFIVENKKAFSTVYHKLYGYINLYIEENEASLGFSNMFNLANSQGWSSSLRQCMSAISQKKWYPTRNKIISIGLHLSMDHEQINDMLECAHMEPLCSKNIFESIIIFILEDASLNNMLDKDLEDYSPDDLYLYAHDILKHFDLPEVTDFIDELRDFSEMDDDEC